MHHLSPQLPLTAPWIDHPHARELAAMSAVLDAQPAWSARVQQDLEAGCPTNARTGRPGLTGEWHPFERRTSRFRPFNRCARPQDDSGGASIDFSIARSASRLSRSRPTVATAIALPFAM